MLLHRLDYRIDEVPPITMKLQQMNYNDCNQREIRKVGEIDKTKVNDQYKSSTLLYTFF